MRNFDPKKIRDVYNDPSLDGFNKFAQEIPKEIMELDVPSPEGIPDKAFAYVTKIASGEYVRRFPINNKANTFISYKYACQGARLMPRHVSDIVFSKIGGAMAKFRIKVADQLNPDDSSLVGASGDGEAIEIKRDHQDFKSLIMDGYDEGKEGLTGAMARFRAYYMELDPGTEFEVATTLVDRAEEIGVPVPKESSLYKLRMIDREKLNEKSASIVIKSRIALYKDDGLKKKAVALLDVVGKAPAMSVVESLHELDKVAGVDRYYRKNVMSPFSMFMGKKTLTKTASVAALPNHVVSKMKSLFSDEFTDEFVKKAEQDGLSVALQSVNGRSARELLKGIIGG